jgi:hypothetical protein
VLRRRCAGWGWHLRRAAEAEGGRKGVGGYVRVLVLELDSVFSPLALTCTLPCLELYVYVLGCIYMCVLGLCCMLHDTEAAPPAPAAHMEWPVSWHME